MKSSKENLLLLGKGKWITLAFALFVVSALVPPVTGLRSALSPVVVVTSLVSFLGAWAGFSSSREFGGRTNFTGRLLFFLSISLASLGIGMIFASFDLAAGQNTFVSQTIDSLFLEVFFLLGIIVAAYALLSSAWAVTITLDRKVVSRILLASIVIAVTAYFAIQGETRVTPGSTPLDNLISDIPWNFSVYLLMVGAFVLVAQLGKWYATPGIEIISYGFVAFSLTPFLVRTAVLLSGLEYVVQVPAFLFSLTLPIYMIGLGLNKVRPRTKASTSPEWAHHIAAGPRP